MKRIAELLLLIISAAVLLAACSGNNNIQTESRETAPGTVNTVPLDNRQITAEQLGISAYSTETSRYWVADAVKMKGGKGVTVRAFGEGTAEITVTSYYGKQSHISVTVTNDGSIASCDVTPVSGSDFVDIRAFGAAGDGTTDDTKTVQAAIDSLPETGGTVYFPAGVYNLKDGTVLRNNITVDLQGRTENVMDGYTDELKARVGSGNEYAVLKNAHLYNVSPNGYGRNGAGNITVRGGVIDLNGSIAGGAQIDRDQKGPADRNVSGTCAMIFSCASGLTFDNVIIKDCYNGHAFQLTGCSDVLIRDCLFAGYTIRSETKGSEKDIVTTRETIQVEYAHSGAIPPITFENGEYYYCRNIEISGCNFTKSDKSGYHLIPIGQHGMNREPNCTGFRITGCNFDNPYMYAIRLLSYSDVEITGNTFSSLLKSTGYGKNGCYMIFCALQQHENNYAGESASGKKIRINYAYPDEAEGSKNTVIENNTFKIVKNSYFRVLSAVSPALDVGARTVSGTIRQIPGSLLGRPYTGYIKTSNVIEGLYFKNNRIKYSGSPANTDCYAFVQNVRDFECAGNTVSGFNGFTESAEGVEGLRATGLVGREDSKTRILKPDTLSCGAVIDIGSGEKAAVFGSGIEITLKAGKGIRRIDIDTDTDGNAVVTVICEEGYTFRGWTNQKGAYFVRTGNVKLTSPVEMTAQAKK